MTAVEETVVCLQSTVVTVKVELVWTQNSAYGKRILSRQQYLSWMSDCCTLLTELADYLLTMLVACFKMRYCHPSSCCTASHWTSSNSVCCFRS